MSEMKVVTIENEIRIKAPADRVWRAMTTEQLEWYPYTYGRDKVRGLVFEERPGGRVYEDWGDGDGHLYGTVTQIERGSHYSTRGQLSPTITIQQWVELEEDGEQTVLKGKTVCFGLIEEEMEKAIQQHGDLANFEDQLRAYLEG